MKRGPLSLVRMIEEILERISSGFRLQKRLTAVWNRGPHHSKALSSQNLVLKLAGKGGSSFDIVRLRNKSHRDFFCIHSHANLIPICLPYAIQINLLPDPKRSAEISLEQSGFLRTGSFVCHVTLGFPRDHSRSVSSDLHPPRRRAMSTRISCLGASPRSFKLPLSAPPPFSLVTIFSRLFPEVRRLRKRKLHGIYQTLYYS
jgi:hypothetical protein